MLVVLVTLLTIVNFLQGLTFVFTGELESLSREEAQDLAKRYGALV